MLITCVKEKCEHKMCMFKHPINYEHVQHMYEFPMETFINQRTTFSWAVNINANNKSTELWCIGIFTKL